MQAAVQRAHRELGIGDHAVGGLEGGGDIVVDDAREVEVVRAAVCAREGEQRVQVCQKDHVVVALDEQVVVAQAVRVVGVVAFPLVRELGGEVARRRRYDAQRGGGSQALEVLSVCSDLAVVPDVHLINHALLEQRLHIGHQDVHEAAATGKHREYHAAREHGERRQPVLVNGAVLAEQAISRYQPSAPPFNDGFGILAPHAL